MDSKLTAILQDLYTLDPSLREREAELIPILEALLRAKPETAFDAQFAQQLRQKLFTPSTFKTSSSPMTPSFINKFAFAGLGGLIALVVAIPLTYRLTENRTSFEEFALGDVSSVPTIKSLGDAAFGILTPTTEASLGAQEARSSVAYGMGGTPAATQPVADGAETNATDADKMAGSSIVIGEPYPGSIIQYAYTYTGTPLDLTTISDAVYRKTGGLNLGNMGNDLTRGQLGPVNLNSFSGLKIQSFSMTQDDKNGYSLYVDPANGMISINGNEGVWGYTGGEYVPFTKDQIMSDADLLATAEKFLADYGVDKTGFGSPVIDDRSLAYALRQPAEFRYIPEVMNVTYPLLLEGQPAYTGDGSPYGLYAMINMRTKTVASVTLNVASSYDKSSYALERDSATILKIAEQGGLYNYPYEGATETVQIELGTPTVILINHYIYSDSGTSETLFIPALSFPITKNSDSSPLYSDAVVIPLVKSVLDQAGKEPNMYILEDAKAR